MPRKDAAAPGQVCPGSRIHGIDIVAAPGIVSSLSRFRSALVVLVVAAPPEPRLVATPRCAVQPLIHAPQTVHSARIGGIGVVDDAILQHERAQALPLSNERRPVGARSGGDLGGWPLLTGRQQRLLVLWVEVVLDVVR